MSSSDTNVVQVIESCAELWANQRICWWVKFTSDAVWLEAENTCSTEVDIISPTSDNGISLNCGTWDFISGETLFKSLPSFSISHLWGTWFTIAISNEIILASIDGITTMLSFIDRPIVITTLTALKSAETQFLESLCWVEFLRISLELWFCQGLNFLGGLALNCTFFFCHFFLLNFLLCFNFNLSVNLSLLII